jgi:hypothetical protein
MSTKKRLRGGQPGNQNARTHGFYSCALQSEDKQKYQEAGTIIGLDDEIALLRSKILHAVEEGENFRGIVVGLVTLSRLLSLNHKIRKEKALAKDFQRLKKAANDYKTSSPCIDENSKNESAVNSEEIA